MLKERGLSSSEAAKKQQQYGLNEIKDLSKATPLKILLRQVQSNFIIYLLVLGSLISFLVGKSLTGYVILVVILMVVTVGFIQEYRAEKAISALRSLLVPVSIVLRDGKEQEVLSASLVPGDIVILRTGEKIPADCLLLEERELRVNESALTGESKEVRKHVGSKHSGENFIFMGTFVVSGRCIARVQHTGMNTRFGKIAGLITTTQKELPLQRKVNRIAKYMAMITLTISLLTGALMLFQSELITREVIINILILVIALSVSAFPEGLPLVLITALAAGAHRMARQNAIVNRMSIIETLGETTVICADKTGTITRGEMTAQRIFAGDSWYEVTGAGYDIDGAFWQRKQKIEPHRNTVLERLLYNSMLCNDATIERTGEDNEYQAHGSGTEAALLILAAKAGLFREDFQYTRIEEIPFSSERKMMSVLCRVGKEKVVYSKGAPEYLLRHCSFIQKGSRIVRLPEEEKKRILMVNQQMTRDSLRTIALAYKQVKSLTKDHYEEHLIFTGLVGLEDPPREEVKAALKICQKAGIKVKMITGDNKETARAIATEIGLSGKLMEGQEVDGFTDEELGKVINSISIFARVNPEHKLRIVKALKSNGEIVTMTGDGVNDAPALKEAHIGVAMGKSGTDVSRSVADLTLKDNNFSTIVAAVHEGRTIFKNIQKFVTYQLSCNIAELAILLSGVLLAPVLGWQIPLLLALQILFINLVTDNLPAITLGLNPSSHDTMMEKPRKKADIINLHFIALMAFTAFIVMLLVISSYFISFNVLGERNEYARTVAMFTLICLEIVSAFTYRSFRKGILNRSLLANPYLLGASLISLLATISIIYSPLNTIFETVPLRWNGIIVAVSASVLLLLLFDVLKYINNRKEFWKVD